MYADEAWYCEIVGDSIEMVFRGRGSTSGGQESGSAFGAAVCKIQCYRCSVVNTMCIVPAYVCTYCLLIGYVVSLASFPGLAQLSVAYSTLFHTVSDGKLGGAWERG